VIEDADEYADLFDAEVKNVLDIHAPLRTGRRVAVVNMTAALYRMKPVKPSSFVLG